MPHKTMKQSHCSSNALNSVPGVISASVCLVPVPRAVVTFDPEICKTENLLEAVSSVGFDALVEKSSNNASARHLKLHPLRSFTKSSAITLLPGLVFLPPGNFYSLTFLGHRAFLLTRKFYFFTIGTIEYDSSQMGPRTAFETVQLHMPDQQLVLATGSTSHIGEGCANFSFRFSLSAANFARLENQTIARYSQRRNRPTVASSQSCTFFYLAGICSVHVHWNGLFHIFCPAHHVMFIKYSQLTCHIPPEYY